MYLELSGFDVLQAADGLAALAKATSCRPDIVILDVSLPRLDGLAVTRRLIPREPQLPSRWVEALRRLTGKAGFSVKDDREGLPAGELVEVDGLRLTGDESQRAGGHLLPAQAGKAASAAERAAVLVQAIIENMG